MGVTRATPSRRRRAASISLSSGAVLVAKVEDLLNDVANGRQRVELSALDGVEDAPQLGVVGHRALEVSLGARRGDGEDLARQVPPPPLLQPAVSLEMRVVLLDPLPQLEDVLLPHRLGEDAEVAARAHRADEDALVEEVVGEADPVAEERARAERARGVDRDHPDRPPRRAQVADERADQARLADSRRPRYADDVRV